MVIVPGMALEDVGGVVEVMGAEGDEEEMVEAEGMEGAEEKDQWEELEV